MAIILIVMLGVLTAIIAPLAPQSAGAQGFTSNDDVSRPEPKTLMAVSQDGNNVYVVWWTNKLEN